jgi:hypothetical protein
MIKTLSHCPVSHVLCSFSLPYHSSMVVFTLNADSWYRDSVGFEGRSFYK